LSLVKKLLKDHRGLAAIEYGLILTLIIVAIMGTLSLIGSNMSNELSRIASSL
jgi:Flp pilus assembly pilin Flp